MKPKLWQAVVAGMAIVGAANGETAAEIAAQQETVVAASQLDDLRYDTRKLKDGCRVMDGAEELLPLARTNIGDWRRGGADGGPAAVMAVTPIVPLANGGAVVSVPVGESETLVTAAGEGTFDAWEPETLRYSMTLTAGDEVLESIRVDMSGYAERCGKVVIENGNWPAIGRPMTVSVSDADGNSFAPPTVTWTRQSADRATSVVLAEEATYTPVGEDLEHWLTVTIGGLVGGGQVMAPDIWFSKLPVAYVAVDGGAWPTAEKEEHTGVMRLQGNDKWRSDKVLYDGALDKIHVRGNASKNYPKKPYKLKLEKKADLLGMGKNKHWVLLANWRDVSLMRDKITHDFSRELGLVAMDSEWVDVIFNGEFVGNYLLCEHIRIDEGRVEVCDWEEEGEQAAKIIAAATVPEEGEARTALEDALAEEMSENFAWLTSGMVTLNETTYSLIDYDIDVTKFDLSGGYIYELDAWEDDPSRFRLTSGKLKNTLIKINAPGTLYTNSQLMQEQQALWQNFFDAVQSADGYANGRSWAEIAEVKSMAAYWLTQVLSANSDVPRSRFAYKDQGGKLTFGPAWDYDNAYGGGDEYTNLTLDELGDVIEYERGKPHTGWLNGTADVGNIAAPNDNFYPLWVDDPYFCLTLYELWQEKRAYLYGLVADGGALDQHYGYLLESALANDARWPLTTKTGVYDRFDGDGGSARRLKACLREQIEWIDSQMTSLGALMESLKSNVSDHPYTDAKDKVVVDFVTEHKQRYGESGTADIVVSNGTDLAVRVSLSNLNSPATVGVYVNGISSGTYAVQNSAVEFGVDSELLDHVGESRNLIALIVRNGAGAVLATSYALVTKVETDVELLCLEREIISAGFNAEDPAGMPIVTVRGKKGEALVEGRDYAVEFEAESEITVKVVVTGCGNYNGTGLADGQVNLAGQVEFVYECGERVAPVASSSLPAAYDTRKGEVRKLLSSRELLPFAWNNAVGWPQGGEGDTQVTVTLQPMTGGNPTGWTASGAARTPVNAAGEGVKRVRATRLENSLYKATLSDGAEMNEEAYFDLTEMEKVSEATMFYLK